jgi:hypothetical protein
MERFKLKTIFAHPLEYHLADESWVWNIYALRDKNGVYNVRVFHWYDDPQSTEFTRDFYTCKAFSDCDLLFKIFEHCIPAIERQRVIHGDDGYLCKR